MDNNYIYERDFYCIDDFYGEEKWFEYFGYTYVEEKYKVVDCHIEEKLSIVLNHKGSVRGWIDEKMSETKQYIDDRISKVEYINDIFDRCRSLSTFPNISKWSTSKLIKK